MINPAFGLDQAIPYALVKVCGRVPEKIWMRLEAELDAALTLDRIPNVLRRECAHDIERMLREPIGYAAIEKRAA